MNRLVRIGLLLGCFLFLGLQPVLGQDDEVEIVEPPLNKAVRNNDLPLVKKLIAEGAPINTESFRDPEAIDLAVELKRVEIAKYLLEHGATSRNNFYGAVETGDLEWVKLLHSFNFRDSEAILAAVESGNLALVKFLIQEGFPVNFSQKIRYGLFRKEYVTPMEIACKENRMTIAMELYKGGLPVVSAFSDAHHYSQETFMYDLIQMQQAPSHDLNMLFLKSVEFGEAEMAARSIAKGADVQAVDLEGNSALMLAVGRGDILMINRCLKDWKIDPTLRNESGENTLMAAVRLENTEIAELIWNNTKLDINERDNLGHTALYHTIFSPADLAQMEFLLKRGAQINLQDNLGNTPLMNAAWHGEKQVVNFLISKGANVAVKNKEGLNVVSYMLESSAGFSIEEIKQLIELGADPKVVGPNGNSIAFYAADKENIQFMKYLAEKGVLLDPRDKYGYRPSSLSDTVIRYLVMNGADVNRADTWGETYLEEALKRNSFELAAWLIDKGADVNYKRRGDEPMLFSLVDKDNLDAIRILVENHADVNCTNRWGVFLIEYAQEHASQGVVDYLRTKGALNKKEYADMQIRRTKELGTIPDLIKAKNNTELMRILKTYPNVALTAEQVKEMAILACEKSDNELLGFLVTRQRLAWNQHLNFEQQTLLHVAAKVSTENFVTLLISKGVDPNLKDVYTKKPVDYSHNKAIKKILKAVTKK
jgi:ankyrin repeat protein